MKSRNVREAATGKLESEEARLEQKDHLSHGDRDLLGAVRRELKRRRKTISRQLQPAAAAN